MTDRRLWPATARIAHVSLRGRAAAARFTGGEPATVAVPVADLRAAPGGARDRQLLRGDAVLVIDREADHAFVQAAKDGYCGWVAAAALGPPETPTHWVAVRQTWALAEPRVQAEPRAALSMTARLPVTGEAGAFLATPDGFLPRAHLRPLAERPGDPVAVMRAFLGAPYLWGGNSAAGLDCSGLIQIAQLACGRACPADSDLQRAAGRELAERDLAAGDLVFWAGHVACLTAPGTIIHANAHHMAVAEEPLAAAAARIAAAGGGPVIARRRL